MNKQLQIKIGAPGFFQIYDLMTRANLSKTFFSEITTKMTMKAVTMRNNFEQRKLRQHLHQLKKVRHKGIEDLMNCALIFLFFFPC